MSDFMTNEMVEVARKLELLAVEYIKLYKLENGHQPVVYITNNKSGESIFISDDLNSKIIKSRL